MDTSSRQQKMGLRRSGRKLFCQRFDKNGDKQGAEYSWKVGLKSQAPRMLFFLICGLLKHRIRKAKDGGPRKIKKAVLRALCEAAEACGCETEFGSEGADVLWFLAGKPLFAFQVHEGAIDSTRKKYLKRSAALLRWIIEIRANGYFTAHPQKANSH